MKLFSRAGAQPRSLKILGWALLPVLVLAVYVQASGAGIDLLVVAVAALALLALERSLGDWLGEWVGPFAAAGIFLVVAIAVPWYFLSTSLGRSRTDSFFVEAERRGYTAAFYPTPRAGDTQALAGSGASGSRAVATGGAARSTASASPGVDRAGGAAGAAEPEDVSSARAEASGGSRDRSVLSFLRRRTDPSERIGTEVSLALEPARVAAGRQTVIRATVRAADGSAASGNVEFTVNNLGVGRIALDAQGVATVTYRTYIAGSHDVRARFAGTSNYASSPQAQVTLTVVGGR